MDLDAEPPDDPDPLVVHSWWTRGRFEVKSGPLLREQSSFVMDMNLAGEVGPWWILLTASPK